MAIAKRIGIDARLWNETGVGRYIRNLVLYLSKIDTTNEYVLFFRKREFDNVSLPGNNFTKVLADFKWHGFKEQLFFPYVLIKQKLDLVHFPYFSVPIFYHKPFIITIHDLILHHFPTGQASTLPKWFYTIKLQAYKFIMQYSANHAKNIITVSEATKEQIHTDLHMHNEKVIVTSEGVDNHFKEVQEELSSRGKLIEYPYFLYVGNAYPHKNLETLIKAFRQFHSKHSDVKFVLVGKEDFFYKRLKRVVAGMGISNIVFMGFVSDNDLSYLYSHAIATMVPSLMEGFGLPALEAMAHHCIVIASDIAVLHEVCGKSAFYVDPTDIDDWKKIMGEVYIAKKWIIEEKKKEAKKRLQLFSWEKMAVMTKKVYESSISVR